MYPQIFQTGEVVDGEEVVNMGEASLDAAGERFVAWGAEEGIEPDQAVATALEATNLRLQ